MLYCAAALGYRHTLKKISIALGEGSMPKAGSIAPVPESRPDDNGGGCELVLGTYGGAVSI